MKSVGEMFVQISANAQPALEALGHVEHGLTRISKAASSTQGTLRLVANESDSSFGQMASSVLKLLTAYRLITFGVNAYRQAAIAASGINPVTGSAFSPRTASVIGAINAQLSQLGPIGRASGGVAAAALSNLGAVASRVGKIIAAFSGLFLGLKVAILAFGTALAITAAGIAGAFKSAQLKESVGAVEAIFKDAAQPVKDFADQVQAAFGRSKKSTLDAATQIGAILTSQGFSEADSATNSIFLLGTAMELAAQRGGTMQDAMTAVAAAVRGEEEPIRRLGITISQALVDKTVQADANLRELAKTNEFTARAAARLILIKEQAAAAFGTMAKESGNLTQQMEKLKGLLSQGITDLGAGFEPLVTAVVRLANAFLQLGGGAVPTFASGVQMLFSPLEKLINLIASVVEGLNKLAGIAGIAPKLGGEIAIPKAAAQDAELEAFNQAQKKFEIEKEYQDRLDALLSDMAEREKKRQEDIAEVQRRNMDEYRNAVAQRNSLLDRQSQIESAMQRPEILSSAAEVFAKNITAGQEDPQLKELKEIKEAIKEQTQYWGVLN